MVALDASHVHYERRTKTVGQSSREHPWQRDGTGSSSCGREREAPRSQETEVSTRQIEVGGTQKEQPTVCRLTFDAETPGHLLGVGTVAEEEHTGKFRSRWAVEFRIG